jgi:diguanylate cyclase (GGDEF)-like protein
VAVQRLSLRSSTIFSVTLIGLIFILISSLTGNYFRQAALNAQTISLSRIIEVASYEVLRNLQRHAINLSTSINTKNNLGEALQTQQQGGSDETIIAILDDPFITGFVGAPDVELEKIRIYDLALTPLLQSSQGSASLSFEMPPHLRTLAAQRRGVERLKAISGLWVSANGPLYSVLLPIGGLHIKGYVEVVFDPRFTLQTVSEMTSMPVSIHLPQESYTPPKRDEQMQVVLPIEYNLYGDDGQIAYHMVGLENIDKLNQDMLQTQWITLVGFLFIIFLVLLLALWLLRIGLFTPLRSLLSGIEQYSRGKLDTTIRPGGLQELYTLGHTFNEMLQRIRDDMQELERYSTLDGLTGIANRRYFDNAMERELCHAKRLQSQLSLLYIDIDYFKRYNDHYGHLSGDEILQRIAQTIASMARRSTDVAARIGGEEFAILLPDTEQEHARLIGENVRLAVNTLEIEHADSSVSNHVTLSIGVATIIPGLDTQPNELLGTADRALYRAKAEGRNRVVVAE